MIRQKSISVKLDNDVYELLQEEVGMHIMKANRIINEAVRLYCELADKRRYWSSVYSFRGEEFEEELLRFACSRIRHVGEKFS